MCGARRHFFRAHTPVVDENRVHGKKQEGHGGVADGQLGGGPRHHVVAQLQASGPQEVVAEGFTHLVGRGVRTFLGESVRFGGMWSDGARGAPPLGAYGSRRRGDEDGGDEGEVIAR